MTNLEHRFGERDLSLVRLFWYRRFDNGMVAFLECLTELAAHIQTRDKNFRLPYKYDTLHALYCSVVD